LSVTYK